MEKNKKLVWNCNKSNMIVFSMDWYKQVECFCKNNVKEWKNNETTMLKDIYIDDHSNSGHVLDWVVVCDFFIFCSFLILLFILFYIYIVEFSWKMVSIIEQDSHSYCQY